jgi:chondroitin sulfate synthase
LLTTNEIEIILFLEEKSMINEESIEKIFFQLNQHQQIQACLFLVKLKYVENIYPPQKKSFYAMKFLYTFYQQRTFWLLRLDDNAYVNIEKLLPWLKSIDHQRALYIGQSGSGRRNGPPIHLPDGQYFCMGGSGVILSQRTLIELGPWLDYCLTNEIITKHEDVELGRCILKHVYISCTNAYNSKSLFYHHYGPRYSFGHDLTPSIISQALILHPIKDHNTFKQIFAFYLREKQYLQTNFPLKSRKSPINYVTFLSRIEFDLVRDIHYQLIDARWRLYIKEAVRLHLEQMRMIWYKRSLNWTLTHGYFLFGYHRVIPSYGLESIVEIQLHAHSNTISPMEFTSGRKRFYIRQTFSNQHRFDYREINLIEINESIYQLNLIVVSCNKDEALKRFIKNFQREVLNNPDFTLTILYFMENNQTNNEIIDLINQLSKSRIRLSIVNQKDISYNRGLGRQLASKLFTTNQILFFLDVDLEFTSQALDNTRRLMIHQLSSRSNCTVYFPIIFSRFSNMFVHDNDIHEKNGLFSIYGFGNVAVRKQDLDQIGGWETNNHDWGNEDVNLFQRFTNPSTECYIFRTVEPGLRHYYHKKMCNGIVNIERQKMCHDADINLLGSQMDMVNYLLDMKD